MMREDWIEVKLGEICDLKNGFAFKSKDYVEISETMNFRMSQIRPNGKIDLDHNPKYLPDEYASSYSDYLLENGDIVIAMTDMASDTKILGVPTIVKQDKRKLLLNQRVGKLFNLNTNCVYIPYLRYIITSPQIYSYYKKLGKGGVQINLSKDDILNAKLPLAPLPEQRAIAAKIEQLFSELDNGIANFKAAKSKLEIYRQAILKQAFEGELTKEWRENNKYGLDSISSVINKVSEQRKRKYEEGCKFSKENGLRTFKPQNLIPIIREYHIQLPKEWIWLSMSDISSADQHSMSSGPFGSCLGTKDYQESGIPVIRGKNIQKGKFVCDDFVFISEEKALSLTRSLAYSGDIIVVAVGSSGEAALVPKELKKSVISQNCNKFTLDESIVDSKFVLFCLQNQIVRTQMTEKTTDTVRTFLSLTSLKRGACHFCKKREKGGRIE